ncbi:MAG: hypothetical protein PHE27_09190 [Alphaproteobacteria bacterium]|nr:hypothetical protein [Alphaproteobacteria bacterium]
MDSIAVSSAIQDIRRFRHTGPAPRRSAEPVITRFEAEGIETGNDTLTLVVRTDTNFATREIKSAFAANALELTKPKGKDLSEETFNKVVAEAYCEWGTKIVNALAENLDYDCYTLPPPLNPVNIHFHSADSLAHATIKKAQEQMKDTHGENAKILYVSLDDMIHEDVFRLTKIENPFAEIGFSRLFSQAGRESGYVARPGRTPIENQIEEINAKVKEMRGDDAERVSIMFLEDNVRYARTPLWIIKEMEQAGVFENARIDGIATCFSVATEEEQEKLLFEGKKIPLIIGVNYANSKVDVVTPRDHFFDGMVVRDRNGKLGRIPSFLLAEHEIAKNFKIAPERAASFRQRIIDANIAFCNKIEKKTSIVLPLDSFTPGKTIANILDIPEKTPMVQVLKQAKARQKLPPNSLSR